MTSDVKKIAHNGKFDIKFIQHHWNIQVNNFWVDTMLLHYVLDENKKHGLKVFRKLHPGGTLSKKLLSSGDLMVKAPFVSENCKMKKTLKMLSQKKLGLLVVKNKRRLTTGLIVDGDIKRASRKYKNLHELKVKDIMTRKPLSVDKDTLAVQCLNLMNMKRITSLLVHENNKKNKTIGVLHIHKVLENVQ